MTIKEITNLRKSGRLQEALEAANNEFSKNSKYKEIIYFINLVLKNMHI